MVSCSYETTLINHAQILMTLCLAVYVQRGHTKDAKSLRAAGIFVRDRWYHIVKVHSRMRIFKYLFAVPAITCLPVGAQIAEPILTKTAIPLIREEGAIKLDYVGGIGQSRGSSQVIPEATLETGILAGLEVLVRFPLLLVRPVPGSAAVIGGGQLPNISIFRICQRLGLDGDPPFPAGLRICREH